MKNWIYITIIALLLAFFPSFNTQTVTEEHVPTVVKKPEPEAEVEFGSIIKDDFVKFVSSCIDKNPLSKNLETFIPKDLIIAQAGHESSWGNSRFAREANNLFGIRTWDEDTPHVKPVTHDNKWYGWGVKAYMYKCDSVKDVVRILNDLHFYESLREERDKGADATILAYHLESFSTNPKYGDLLNDIIRSEF